MIHDPPSKLRIAWTGPIGHSGGVPEMGLLLLKELIRQGAQVDVYTPSYAWQEPPVEPMAGLRIIERRSRWRWGRWYSRTRARALLSGAGTRSLSHLILNVRLLMEHRRRPYDAVYQLSTSELFLLGRLRKLAPPIVVHPCTHAAGELRWHRSEAAYALESEGRLAHLAMRSWQGIRARLQPKELARADLVVGLSERFNELVHEDYGVPREKLRVIRTPVDLDRFHPNGGSPATEPRTVLFVSRISARKGVEDVVELSHRLSDLAGSVRLLIVGGPTQWSDYRGHLRELDPTVAEYVGHVPSEALPAMLQSASMLLIPSRYEPGSIVAAEALGCAVPVVLSTEVGNGEALRGPHVGFHAPGDVDDLERAVREMLGRIGSVEEMGIRASARANAEQAFAPAHVASELIDLLSSFARPVPAPVNGHAPVALPGPGGPPGVTVCICTRRRPDDLRRALRSIGSSTVPVSQVVVSDDGHDAVTEAVCREARVPVDYRRGPQLGLGANRNCALGAVTGDLVLFIDDDCTLLPEFLETAIATMRTSERRYGRGRVIISGAEINRGRLVGARDQTFLGHQSVPYREGRTVRTICINATLFPVEAFARFQFDPQLIYGYEEVDIASRLTAGGFTIVQSPDAINHHKPSSQARDDHDCNVEASRLYVTFRRYAITDRRIPRAAAFAMLAPPHLLLAGIKRDGPRGVDRGLATLGLTTRMLAIRSRRGGRAPVR
jgi:glycosyltransferase involved in cell wall biosynthesis